MQRRSLRAVLVAWLSAGLLLAGIVAAIATYLRAHDEANVLFDYQLQQMAASLTGMPIAASAPPGAPPGADALVVQVWDRNGVQVYLSQPQNRLPQHAQLGFRTVVTDRGEQWRVFSMLAEHQVVQVAQPMTARAALARSMALRTVIPLLAVLPLLALFAWFAIAQGLRPIERLAQVLRQRSSSQLQALPETGLPQEIAPLVHALNGLLARLDEARSAQRTFIADAAHELRTPLTAVHLQAQLAERATTADERATAFAELAAGIDRATHLIEQLLTLAREEPGVTERAFTAVDLAALAREVITDRATLAAAGGIDLGLAAEEAPGTTVAGDRDGLYTLLANLVDNAVRYTPAGGRVDVSVTRDAGQPVLCVRDTGPGLPPDEHPRVFDRFYRAPGASGAGSGLGLAIVKRIAERHGATIELGPGLPPADDDTAGRGPGLGVTVRFPAPQA